MPARSRASVAVLAGVLTLTVTPSLAGCAIRTGGHSAGGMPQAPDSGRIAALYRRLAQCIRAHGAPNFPDFAWDPAARKWKLPQGTARPPDAAINACKSLSDERLRLERKRPLSAADVALLREFAACMRAQGVRDWPDPDAVGVFSLPPQLIQAGRKGVEPQIRACRGKLPAGGLRIASPTPKPR